MKRVLLVSPDSDNEGLWVTGEEDSARTVSNNMVPLGLATVAALTPPSVQVDIWDELVHGRIGPTTDFNREYDLVGITGFKVHLPRCREISAECRRRGIAVAVGGPGVSGTPDAYRGDFDVLFIGEAEHTWPKFLADWEAGDHASEYRQIEKPDMADSPMPRWDSIEQDLPRYAMGCVQTTRGCPFDCEFCDVIYLFGRRARHKPIERILEEVRVLERLGMSSIFFCDDEFIGDPRYAKELLRALLPLNNSFEKPLTYSTQLTMNLSRDDELLEMMADANFNLVFIGIESPKKESLRGTNKLQNVRKDLVGDVRKILSYGIAIRAGIIVGFDPDDMDIFDMQYDFIQAACLPSTAINMLKAPLGTKLWSRLRQEGRVVSLVNLKDKLGHARSYTNILPKSLSRVELLEGYKDLLQRVHSWESFEHRVRSFVSLVQRAPRIHEAPLGREEALKMCQAGGLSNDEEKVVRGLIDHTAQIAPFMMRRIKSVIVQFVRYRETLEQLYPQLDAQIRLEATGGFPLEPDDRPIAIPDGFRKTYGKLFPQIHRRVYTNLEQKDRVPEALTEVFVDFLVRWGDSFRSLEPHHVDWLQEICDRTSAKFNGNSPQQFVAQDPDSMVVPSTKRSRLGDDVLKTVEQELVKYAGTP